MRKNFKLLGAVAVAGLVATTGSAFTAGNTVVSSVAGYGTATVTGATSTVIEHTLNATGDRITSSAITFSPALTANHAVKAGFGTTALEGCSLNVDFTVATCTYASTGYATADAAKFNVAVS